MIFTNLICMVMLSVFLLAVGNTPDSIFVILIVWISVLAGTLFLNYFQRKKRLDKLMRLAEGDVVHIVCDLFYNTGFTTTVGFR